MTDFPIRRARIDEFDRVRAIEDAAEVLFEKTGLLDGLADAPDDRDARLRTGLRDGRVFVTANDEAPVGLAFVDEYDEHAHLEELDVHPDWGRRGIGRQLVEHVIAWAGEQGYAAVTLATFRDIPWNGPFYASCGFTIVDEADYPPHAQMIRANEAHIGFNMESRVIMIHPLGM